MKYSYSICHPEKENIEYPLKKMDKYQIIEFVENYPWRSILEKMESLPDEKIHFSPSLEFKNDSNDRSLGLTATLDDNKIEFSLWYNRPVATTGLLKFLGKKSIMKVIDKWGFDKAASFEHLKTFLNKDYDRMEKIMTE